MTPTRRHGLAALLLLLPAAATAGQPTIVAGGGLAGLDADRLEDPLFGPALNVEGHLPNGLFARAEAMYVERASGGETEDAARRGELRLGWRTRATGRIDAVFNLEGAYLNSNNFRTRTDGGIAIGLQGRTRVLETTIQALYRVPDDSAADPQVGARLQIGATDPETGWGVRADANAFEDGVIGSLSAVRRF